jgi:hypothetical protein
MHRSILILGFAVVVACAATAASAQQGPGGPMMQGPGGRMMQGGGGPMMQGGGPMMQDRGPSQAAPQSLPGQQSGRMPRRDNDDDDRDARGSMMGRGHGSGHHHGGMMGGMMGSRGMGGMSPQMMRMMVILMDSDGDGALSWDEFRTGHERIFRAMDVDKNGRVTFEEMQGFLQLQPPASQQPR